MPHAIAGDSFATFGILRATRFGRSEGNRSSGPQHAHKYSFHGDRAEFRCRAGDIEISWAVCVASHADAEVRALRVENRGAQKRALEFTSYSEVCLNNRRADMAHPAFAKLFVETEYDQATGAIFARRRPRDAKEKPIWGVHVSASSHGSNQTVEYETDRAKFLGRGRTAANPAIFDRAPAFPGTPGPVLDPIFCLRRRVHLEPGESARLAFVTGAGEVEGGPGNRRAILKHRCGRPDILRRFRSIIARSFKTCSSPLTTFHCLIA